MSTSPPLGDTSDKSLSSSPDDTDTSGDTDHVFIPLSQVPGTAPTRWPRKDKRASSTKETAPLKKPRIKKKPDDYIRRPRNAFILFRSEFVKSKQIPKAVEADHRNISRIVGEVWRTMQSEERQVWMDRAEEEKKEHALKYPDYKYSPRPPRSPKNPAPPKRERIKKRVVPVAPIARPLAFSTLPLEWTSTLPPSRPKHTTIPLPPFSPPPPLERRPSTQGELMEDIRAKQVAELIRSGKRGSVLVSAVKELDKNPHDNPEPLKHRRMSALQTDIPAASFSNTVMPLQFAFPLALPAPTASSPLVESVHVHPWMSHDPVSSYPPEQPSLFSVLNPFQANVEAYHPHPVEVANPLKRKREESIPDTCLQLPMFRLYSPILSALPLSDQVDALLLPTTPGPIEHDTEEYMQWIRRDSLDLADVDCPRAEVGARRPSAKDTWENGPLGPQRSSLGFHSDGYHSADHSLHTWGAMRKSIGEAS